ncbi:RNase P/MRP, p29 subunit [Artomyces pyxidatus]|uniref:RNase P/MRP, p29 subunit n=1 Tax=Artomyces pyxidatus TaxID=48021 RepID=A0ACB8SQS9_9AGAM|nr:RNase P/MRP, p29 subunit [Artomyces pyxidatus]
MSYDYYVQQDGDGRVANFERSYLAAGGNGPQQMTSRAKYSSALPFTPQYVQSHLKGANPGALYEDRVRRRRILLENPARVSETKRKRNETRAQRQKEKERKSLGVMGRKEAAEKGVWKLKKEETKYELFIHLHRMWMDYMSELLGLSSPPSEQALPDSKVMPNAAGMHTKLVKADFHGSIMTGALHVRPIDCLVSLRQFARSVRRSKNTALVGLSGIVVHESENAFRVVTQKNKLKLLPKHGSVFAFAVPLYSTLNPSAVATPPGLFMNAAALPSTDIPKLTVLNKPHIEFELYGNQFQFRAAERAGKKFKSKETIEL